MMKSLVIISLLLGLVVAVPYTCDPRKCDDLKKDCLCPRHTPPNDLDPIQTPMFITFTNDDDITEVTQPAIEAVVTAHQNKQGCNVPCTFYISIKYTDPKIVKQLWEDGNEIATHTIDHVADPPKHQIEGARTWLVETAKIPAKEVVGFRAPFLKSNTQTRNFLSQLNFKYDSSIGEQVSDGSPTSPSFSERLWPYTLDFGVPQNCHDLGLECSHHEAHPGLWEIPMIELQDDNGVSVAAMDPVGDTYAMYMRDFMRNYNGNRAPFGVYIHAAWILADNTRLQALNQFLDDALAMDNVWMVTNEQLIDYMRNPVTADEYSAHRAGESCGHGGYKSLHSLYKKSSNKKHGKAHGLNSTHVAKGKGKKQSTLVPQKEVDFSDQEEVAQAVDPADLPTAIAVDDSTLGSLHIVDEEDIESTPIKSGKKHGKKNGKKHGKKNGKKSGVLVNTIADEDITLDDSEEAVELAAEAAIDEALDANDGAAEAIAEEVFGDSSDESETSDPTDSTEEEDVPSASPSSEPSASHIVLVKKRANLTEVMHKSGNCEYWTNRRYFGDGYGAGGTDMHASPYMQANVNVDECAKLCSDDPNCKQFTYITVSTICFRITSSYDDFTGGSLGYVSGHCNPETDPRKIRAKNQMAEEILARQQRWQKQ